MKGISDEDIRKIRTDVEKEFPEDPALQEVYISRRIITRKAELQGITVFEYIRERQKTMTLRTKQPAAK